MSGDDSELRALAEKHFTAEGPTRRYAVAVVVVELDTHKLAVRYHDLPLIDTKAWWAEVLRQAGDSVCLRPLKGIPKA